MLSSNFVIFLTIKEDSHFSTDNSLTRIADELAVGAHNLIWSNFLKSLKKPCEY
jgi:hypothetical protein